MTLAEVRQALFEALHQMEDEYHVGHTHNAALYIHPTDSVGEPVVVRNSLGRVVNKVTKKGAYHSAADEYNL